MAQELKPARGGVPGGRDPSIDPAFRPGRARAEGCTESYLFFSSLLLSSLELSDKNVYEP